MSIGRLLLTLLLLLAASPALAADQKLIYDLMVGGRPVGTREVTIRYLPPIDPGASETRLVESVTTIDASVAGLAYSLKSRASARITDSKISFVASTRQNDEAVEVQVRQAPDGSWMVSSVVSGGIRDASFRQSEVALTGMDILDPVRSRLLDPTLGTAGILLPETGTLVEGPVQDLGEATVTIGGQPVILRRVGWNPQGGRVVFGWNADGLLVDYEMQVLGKTLTGRLRQLPPARSWGEVEVGTSFGDPATTIQEQQL